VPSSSLSLRLRILGLRPDNALGISRRLLRGRAATAGAAAAAYYAPYYSPPACGYYPYLPCY